ncbi:N-alpha-acetyltransferase 50 [Aphelenchoides besseyi]|nr:N-alpha-acetyltransferase 50 [Aphelenchoides besseyi]KAI6225540.1 N-alpha-acetyltransferase 50 [Aphelenchoides besseyi]
MSSAKRKADSYDPYAVLGLSHGSSNTEIDKAFKKLALKWHPDKNADNVEVAAKKFIEIYKAYDFLKDETKKTEFDETAAAKKQRAAYDDQRKAASTAKRQYFLDKLEEKERAFENKQKPKSTKSRSPTDEVDKALLRRLRAEGAELLRKMAEQMANEEAKQHKAATDAVKQATEQKNAAADPYGMSAAELAALEAETFVMTVEDQSKTDVDAVEKTENELAALSMKDKRTNIVNHELPERKCNGKISIELGDITQHNLLQVKRLNEAVFPVTYNERFYQEVVERSELAKIVYFNDCVVGAVCCRLETKDNEKKLYIMTLGVLAPYRRFGIGGMLLNYVLGLCDRDAQIKNVALHVQINNESALNFYENFGFKKSGTIEKYYKKIEPNAAFLVEKSVNSFDD